MEYNSGPGRWWRPTISSSWISDCRRAPGLRRLSTVMAGSVAAAALILGYGRNAYGGYCSGGPVVYTCSGQADSTTDTRQNLQSVGQLQVSTTAGFGLDFSGSVGFWLRSETGVTFTDLYNSTISADGHAINVQNTLGDIVITATGTVTGRDGRGIWSRNATDASRVAGGTTIVAGEVYGSTDGIRALNFGSGLLTVTANGDVTGKTGYGIFARGTGSGTHVTAYGYVYGGNVGIQANGLGAGDVSVDAKKTVRGITSHGIAGLITESGVGDLSITAAAVYGGAHGIEAINRGTGNVTVTASGTVTGTGTSSVGIFAEALNGNSTVNAADVNGVVGIRANASGNANISANNVYGELTGIAATSAHGGIRITTTGSVKGMGQGFVVNVPVGIGISALNSYTATYIIIDAASAWGAVDGIRAINRGSGPTRVTASGEVTGVGRYGIYSVSYKNAGNMYITITETGEVHGVTAGIHAQTEKNSNANIEIASYGYIYGENYGIRAIGQEAVSITTTGKVTGKLRDGILTSGAVIDITAAEQIYGGESGIEAIHSGYGDAFITTHKLVEGKSSHGISFSMGGSAIGDLTISTAAVKGGQRGLSLVHNGFGDISIDATDTVTGENAEAIHAKTQTGKVGITATDVVGHYGIVVDSNNGVSIDVINVTADVTGIHSINSKGGHKIVTRGTVRAEGQDSDNGIESGIGILAVNDHESTTYLTIEAVNVYGKKHRIKTYNIGTGATQITAYGHVMGNEGYGITATSGMRSGDLIVTVTENGLVEGGTAAIHAAHQSDEDFRIKNYGTIRNSSGDWGDLAIALASQRSGATIENYSSNSIIGRINATDQDDLFDNFGRWSTTGISDFGDGLDQLTNRAGAHIEVAAKQNEAELTQWQSLEAFENFGSLSFMDGGTGDRLETSGNFWGGGEIWFDVFLGGSDSPADFLYIGRNVYGESTAVFVNNVGGEGGATEPGDGIPIIEVGEFTDGNNFYLGDEVVIGSWRYDIVLLNNVWYLQSTNIAAGTNLYPIMEDSVLALGRDLVGTLWERVGLRYHNGLHNSTGGRPYGAWFRTAGSHKDGRGTLSGSGFAVDGDFDTNYWLAQSGLDGEPWTIHGGTLVAGVFGHMARSDATAKAAGDKGTLDLDGYGGGGSATWYWDDGTYVDALGLATFYSSAMSSQELDHLGSPEGVAFAASLEVGKEEQVAANLTLVPQAQLIYQYLDFDGFTDSYNNPVDFGDDESLQVRLGMAVKTTGHEQEHGVNSLFYAEANILHEFLDPVSVNIAGDHVSYTSDETEMEFGAGLNRTSVNQSGVAATFYLDGDYRMPVDRDGTTTFSVAAGWRFNW